MTPLPKALLVDLDDTILDDSGCVDTCWADACAEAGAPDLGYPTLRQAIREYADWWWSAVDRNARGRLELRAATREIVVEVFRRGSFGDETVAVAIANRYRDLREERATPFPGAIEALDYLRSAGVRLGMMTNGAAAPQRDKIERFKLAPYFQHIVIEGEFGAGKPDRRVYETLLRELGADPGDTWAIGDNLEFDVIAPMKLGIHGIWVDVRGRGCDGRPDKPDRIVAALADLVGG